MDLRRGLAVGTALVVSLVVFAACGSSATTAPTATPAAATPAAAVTSAPAASTAAGGGGAAASAAAGGGQVDASTILTADMAASIIGGSPTKVTLPGIGNVLPGGLASLASYTNANGDSVVILVEKVPGGAPADALRMAVAMAGIKGNSDLQPVSGLGDSAGKVVGDHDATIAFAKGGTIVVVGATADGQAGSGLEPKLESVAQQVAGKV